MSNLIQNPNMGNFKLDKYFTDQQGKDGTIEVPEHWDFVYIPRESDPNKIPQSLHRDNGFIMSAGYRAWEAGYKQSGIHLTKGRYRLKARFKADVNFAGGQAPDLTAITWRFTVESSAGKLEPNWAMTGTGKTKQTEDYVYIFEIEEDLAIDATFWGRSFYAGNDCDFWVYEVSLEEIDKDNALVDTLGTASPVNTTEQIAIPESIDATLDSVGEGSRSLGNASLTVNEIDQIAGALRKLAVASSDDSTSSGLNKLAEVLERLK